MSIKCVCINGHVLHVKDSQAGVLGLCPTCRTQVKVPRPHRKHSDMSEDAILNILGDHATPPHQGSFEDTSEDLNMFSDTSLSGIHRQGTPKKCCDRCNQEVSADSHICPHCHTYIASLKDF